MKRNFWIIVGLPFVIGIIGGIAFPPLFLLTLPGFVVFYYEYRMDGNMSLAALGCDMIVFVFLGLFWLSFDGMVNLLLAQSLVNRIAGITTMTFATGIPLTCVCGLGRTQQTTPDSHGFMDETPKRVVLIPEDEFRKEHQITREEVSSEHHLTRKQTGLDTESRRVWSLCDNCGRNMDADDVERLKLGMSVVCSCGHVNIRSVTT